MKNAITRIIALAILTCAVGCGANPAPVLIGAQGSHDLLALAQDEEVQLCLGVPNVSAASALPAVNHCTTSIAQTIGLTDARHQTFQGQMAKAFSLHQQGVRLAQAGTAATSADQTALQNAISTIVALLGQLQATPEVVTLLNNVKAGAQ